jgi:hypothetical protein
VSDLDLDWATMTARCPSCGGRTRITDFALDQGRGTPDGNLAFSAQVRLEPCPLKIVTVDVTIVKDPQP